MFSKENILTSVCAISIMITLPFFASSSIAQTQNLSVCQCIDSVKNNCCNQATPSSHSFSVVNQSGSSAFDCTKLTDQDSITITTDNANPQTEQVKNIGLGCCTFTGKVCKFDTNGSMKI